MLSEGLISSSNSYMFKQALMCYANEGYRKDEIHILHLTSLCLIASLLLIISKSYSIPLKQLLAEALRSCNKQYWHRFTIYSLTRNFFWGNLLLGHILATSPVFNNAKEDFDCYREYFSSHNTIRLKILSVLYVLKKLRPFK